MPIEPYRAWGVLFRSRTQSGLECNLVRWMRDGSAVLFPTRKAALEFIEQHYGYIRTRPDLRKEPHGWRMPKAVRVTITVEVKQ